MECLPALVVPEENGTPNTYISSQEPRLTSALNRWMRYRGEWKKEGKGNFQSFNPQMKNVQFGSNTKIGGDLTATKTIGSTFQTGTTENLALANNAGAGASAGAGGDTSLTVAVSASATVYPTGTTKKFRREILGLDDEE